MADCYIVRRGGGGGLNFKVKAYASEILLPPTAEENTIAIITSTPITGYQFSHREPVDVSEGFVWMHTGTSEDVAFSATKGNAIMLYPERAKQYINGAWIAVKAFTFMNGSWNDWVTWFYAMGEQFDNLTGGWVCRYAAGSASGAQNTSTGLYAKTTNQSGAYTHNWYTSKAIDVTPFASLHAKMITTNIDSGKAYVRFGLNGNNTDTANQMSVSVAKDAVANTVMQFDLDVSSTSGSFFIKLNYQGGNSAEVRWQEVWAE